MAGNPLLGILPRPFNSSICTYCLCYSFLPALLCNNEGWEYPDLHQLGSTAEAAVIPSLTEWSAEGFVKHTHTLPRYTFRQIKENLPRVSRILDTR